MPKSIFAAALLLLVAASALAQEYPQGGGLRRLKVPPTYDAARCEPAAASGVHWSSHPAALPAA
jgi:hypothetical protein